MVFGSQYCWNVVERVFPVGYPPGFGWLKGVEAADSLPEEEAPVGYPPGFGWLKGVEAADSLPEEEAPAGYPTEYFCSGLSESQE